MNPGIIAFLLFPVRVVIFVGLFVLGCAAIVLGCFYLSFKVGRQAWQVASGEKTMAQLCAEMDERA